MKYALECPGCLARFVLKRVVPGKRVRCRKCRAVIIIPDPGGPPSSRELDPRLRRKLVGTLSLARLVAVAVLLVMALGAGLFILFEGRQALRVKAPAPRPVPKLTLEDMGAVNRRVVLPLEQGFTWDYALQDGGTEQRRVVSVSTGPVGAPEYDLSVIGGSREGYRVLRVLGDGIYLISEVTPEGRAPFTPPMKLVSFPMYTDDRWSYEGGCARPGEGYEAWKLGFEVHGAERIECKEGSFVCFRLEVDGERGSKRFSETLWYAIGVGLVKRRTKVDGGMEEAVLTGRGVNAGKE